MRTCVLLVVILVAAARLHAQEQAGPLWIHLTPHIGMAIDLAHAGAGPHLGLQLELSRDSPFGFGLAVGTSEPNASAGSVGVRGAWAEVLGVYRLRLRAGGRLAPYLGAVAGGATSPDDAAPPAATPTVRGYLGARAGMDLPFPVHNLAFRLELGLRRILTASTATAGTSASAAVGVRWSMPRQRRP